MPVPTVDRGPFLEGLDWLGRLPQVPLNLLRGRPGAAGRQLLDLGGDVIDSVVPGDVIGHISTEEDTATPHELLGIDPETSPAASRIADIVGNTVANPATYLTGSAGRLGKPTYKLPGGVEVPGVASGLAKAKELAQKGYERLPEAAQKVGRDAATTTRRTMNWLDLKPEDEAVLNSANGQGNVASKVNLRAVEDAYKGSTLAEQEAVGEIEHQIQRIDPKDRATWKVLDDTDAYLANRTDVRPDVVKKILEDRRVIGANQVKEPGIFNDQGMAPDDYIQRQFSGLEKSAPSALKARAEELKSPEGLLKYLQDPKNAGVDLEFNALKSDASRAQQQGALAGKAALGREALGMQDFTLANKEHVAAMDKFIADAAADPATADYAYRLQNAFHGTPERGWFSKTLQGANKIFKGAATYGILLPRVAFSVRNRIGGLWQALSEDTARGTFGATSKRALGDLLGAFDDGFKKLSGSRLTSSELTKNLDSIDAALAGTGGDTAKFRAQLAAMKDGDKLVSALDNGVLDNFVSSEELLSRMAGDSKWAKTKDVLMWPASIGQGLEQRMRLGTYMDLLKGGKTPAQAAKVTRDAYLDYATPGIANRTFRDIVPFGAFLSQNIKQQSKFLVKHPGVAVAAGQLIGGDDEQIKYPWMEGQTAVPIGLDEQNNPQYITGFGLPIEGMAAIPGLGGDDSYRDIVGSLQPILKTGIASITGKDPFTGNEFGSFDKILGMHAGAAGRATNIALGTGLGQPVSSGLAPITTALDPRKSAIEKAAQILTGVKIQSVDPDLAQRQQIEEYLKSRPDIQKSPNFYQNEKDQETTDMLQQLSDAKQRLKKKRDAAKASL